MKKILLSVLCWMACLVSAVAATLPAEERVRIVQMPLFVPEEDLELQAQMETALVQGLQSRYDVLSGEKVQRKATEIFNKENQRSLKHGVCDSTRCLQDIAIAFQADMISTATVSKLKDGYLLTLKISNIETDEVVFSNTLDCRGCDAYGVINRLKALGQKETLADSGLKSFRDCAECPEMIELPKGAFKMGSQDADAPSAEKPQHRVTLAAFSLSKTEITQGQWKSLMGANPSEFARCGDACPVENVSWADAQLFIKKLSEKTGQTYRLPSEAEWEYACRGNTPVQQEFCGGESEDEVAWYAANGANSAHPVAQKKPNAFGLYDMSGNVWEWVQDAEHPNYEKAPTDGKTWEGAGDKHIVRGGSWFHPSKYLRSTARGRFVATERNASFGFRVARALK